jgi:hypothetical protein
MTTRTPSVEWDALQGGAEVAPDDLLEISAGELEEFVAGRPNALEEIRVILDRRLRSGIGPDTWGDLIRSLSEYVGWNAARLLTWGSTVDGRDEQRTRRVERVEATGHPAAVDVLRGIRATHGVELQEAWELFSEPPENWRSIDREILVDIVRGRPLVRIVLTKNNGETFKLESPADSCLNLAAFLSATLVAINDRAAFSEAMTNYYVEQATSLLDLLRSSPASTDEAEAEAALEAGTPTLVTS